MLNHLETNEAVEYSGQKCKKKTQKVRLEKGIVFLQTCDEKLMIRFTAQWKNGMFCFGIFLSGNRRCNIKSGGIKKENSFIYVGK